MNIATMVFLTNAGDIVTELLNNPKMSDYKALLLEIGSDLSQINKKTKRIYKNNYDDIICKISDDTNQYLVQLDNFYRRRLITDVQYSKIELAARILILVIMVDHAQGLYLKTQTDKNLFKNDFNNLYRSTTRFLDRFDCMIGNDKNKPIFCNETDSIIEKMLFCMKNHILEFNKNK